MARYLLVWSVGIAVMGVMYVFVHGDRWFVVSLGKVVSDRLFHFPVFLPPLVASYRSEGGDSRRRRRHFTRSFKRARVRATTFPRFAFCPRRTSPRCLVNLLVFVGGTFTVRRARAIAFVLLRFTSVFTNLRSSFAQVVGFLARGALRVFL